MKSNRIYAISTLCMIIITGIVLYCFRKDPYSLEEAMEKIEGVRPDTAVIDQIAGVTANYSDYLDLRIEKFEDLVNCSKIIVRVRISGIRQLDKTLITEAEAIEIYKDGSGMIHAGDHIKFAQYANIPMNVWDQGSSGSFDPNRPMWLNLTGGSLALPGEEYVVFLNQTGDFTGYYKPSTILYSVIPYKDVIRIGVVNSTSVQRPLSLDLLEQDRIDYLAFTNVPMPETANEDTEKYQRAALLYQDYIERYMEICKEAVRLFGGSPQIEIIDL